MFRINHQLPSPPLRGWLLCCLTLIAALAALLWPQAGRAQDALPTIRVPYFADGANPGQGAIFWLGKVEPETNYADVRIAYDDEALVLILHIFDRRTWYDASAGPGSDLLQFDSVSLYLDAQNDLNAPLGAGSRRFDAALSFWQPRTSYQRAYTWEGGAWQPAGLDFRTESGFRAELNDEEDDRGWSIRFRVPFAGLGLAAAPAQGSVLRMALFLHDRDALSAGVLPDQRWPRAAAADQPATWGRLSLGMPAYKTPYVPKPQAALIRHGANGAVVPDAAVGGHSECGAAYNPNFFQGWGDANYAGYSQFNIQNQWDVADWPCFSKFYITFPLAALPADTSVVSATLTMYMFGNAGYGPGDAKPSYMQVARVAEDWSEQTLTWNNAPPVLENYTWSWVDPVSDPNDHSARPRTWDLTRAAADAHAAGQPLRLVVYSTDGDYHSGKYFWAAEMRDEGVRPRLDVVYGIAGYAVEAAAVRQRIHSGETAQYELNVSGLRPGESVTIAVGPSTPPGLDISVSPAQIAEPGGKAVVALTDAIGTPDARVYRVPVTTRSGEDTRTVELFVLVNGVELFLPAVRR